VPNSSLTRRERPLTSFSVITAAPRFLSSMR
jgi:hypothetical protein